MQNHSFPDRYLRSFWAVNVACGRDGVPACKNDCLMVPHWNSKRGMNQLQGNNTHSCFA